MNRIGAFFHCRKCLAEKPPNESPREWARLEAGWTEEGFQVWCVRHDCNVIDISFDGQKVSPMPDGYHTH